MKRQDALKSIKMPAGRVGEEEAGADLESLGAGDEEDAPEEGSPEEEAGESSDEEAAEGDAGALGDASDDELIEELRKRGLLDDSQEKDIMAKAGPGAPSVPGLPSPKGLA